MFGQSGSNFAVL